MSTVVCSPPGASQEAIQFHYDAGNKFYALWLDPTMTYSCGLWYGDEDLYTAQCNKIDWHLQHAGVERAKSVLDIGCGWGAMLNAAITKYGIERAVGLSLSAEQVCAITESSTGKIDVRLESWLDHVPEQPYDSIVSVGAFEHFARLDQIPAEKLAGYRRFFEFCHRNLTQGGRLSLQTITYQDSSKQDFSVFFAEQVFPESDLPHLEEIVSTARGLFEIEVLRNDRLHYARTSRCWLSNLRARRDQAVELVGEDKVVSYEKFLGLLVVSFHIGTMNLARIAFRRVTPR